MLLLRKAKKVNTGFDICFIIQFTIFSFRVKTEGEGISEEGETAFTKSFSKKFLGIDQTLQCIKFGATGTKLIIFHKHKYHVWSKVGSVLLF